MKWISKRFVALNMQRLVPLDVGNGPCEAFNEIRIFQNDVNCDFTERPLKKYKQLVEWRKLTEPCQNLEILWTTRQREAQIYIMNIERI